LEAYLGRLELWLRDLRIASTFRWARLCALPRALGASDRPGQCSFSESQYSRSKQLAVLGWPLIRG
jgi:hypothetical protein